MAIEKLAKRGIYTQARRPIMGPRPPSDKKEYIILLAANRREIVFIDN